MASFDELYAQQTQQFIQDKTGGKALNYGRGGVALRPTQTVTPTKVQTPRPGVVQQFTQKVGDVAGQVSDLSSKAAIATAKFAIHTPGYVYRDIRPFLKGVASTVTGEYTRDLNNQNKLRKELEDHQSELVRQYHAGNISADNYANRLRDLSRDFQTIGEDSQKTASAADAGNVAESAAWTAFTILSAGSLEGGGSATTRIGVRQAFKEGAVVGSKNLLEATASGLEKVVAKIPAVGGEGGLLERNMTAFAKREGQMLAGENLAQMVARDAKPLAVGLLIKRPIFYEQNIGGAQKIYNALMAGDYPTAVKSSAWLATQMLNGGPIGAFLKGLSTVKGKLGSLAYGTDSVIDLLSKEIGDKNPSQVARFIQTATDKAPGEASQVEKTFRILQETNLRVHGENARDAVAGILRSYDEAGISRENITPSMIYKDYTNWSKADELKEFLANKGLIPGFTKEEARQLTPVRFDSITRNALADAARKNGLAGVEDLINRPGYGAANNELFQRRINNIFAQAASNEEAAKLIQAIDAAALSPQLGNKLSKQFADLGYTIAMPVGGRKVGTVPLEDTRKLISSAIKGGNGMFDEAKQPIDELHTLAVGLEKAGISPKASGAIATRKLAESVVSSLDEVGAAKSLGIRQFENGDVVSGGQVILGKLKAFVDSKPASRLGKALVLGETNGSAITDIRQLGIGDIQKAVGGITRAEAKEISKAAMKGYLQTPLEFRGLGDKIVDGLYAINPLQKHYSRIQSALRYTYNPFFRAQERVETKMLSHAGASNLVWNRSPKELNAGAKILEEAGVFTTGLPGEAAQDQVLGKLTANISRGQKRDLAGLAYNIAESKGVPLETLLRESPDEVVDALRVVVQYPNKGILASPLARTMNLAFFPLRYNLKVTQLAAQTLAKQPPSVQLAVVNSMFKMKDWLKSDEGIRWQSNHADAIQVLKWITPVNSIEAAYNMFGHKPDSISQLGVLGGLPLGVITQMLDSQGIIHLNRPYVNPKTGDVVPKYVPQSAKARVSVALGDILGSMFTYPGRILGLPGKEATTKEIVKQFIATNGTDFDKNIDMERLTPLQQQWVRVLKGDTSQGTLDKLYNMPAPGQFNWYTLPPTDLPTKKAVVTRTPPVARRSGLPSKAKSGPRAKKLPHPIPTR